VPGWPFSKKTCAREEVLLTQGHDALEPSSDCGAAEDTVAAQGILVVQVCASWRS
jgi:hypothetical protein